MDEKRLLILRKRFGDHPAEKRADLFLRAWMMIQAASAGGVSFFQKKRQKKELCGYLMQLGIRTDEKQNVEKDADVEDVCGYILEEEWKNFAYTYLASCTGSRAYCSTLFGIVPIKDAAVAELNTTAAAKAVANTLFIAFITFISSFLSKIFMRKFSPLGKN